MGQPVSIKQHDLEIHENLDRWNAKPLLRQIYKGFHQKIAAHTIPANKGITVELGSGIGNIKDVLPHCLRTDLFPNPWIDQTENAYQLSFKEQSVANIILFDVLHHLRYPGTAFAEFSRVLVPGGRVIIFDPCMSALGLGVYGIAHHEPVAVFDKIEWMAPKDWTVAADSYYAAQGNAYRIFWGELSKNLLNNWNIILKTRSSELAYVASGGYSKKQLYPSSLYGLIKKVENICDYLPLLFATRLLVVLEKSW